MRLYRRPARASSARARFWKNLRALCEDVLDALLER